MQRVQSSSVVLSLNCGNTNQQKSEKLCEIARKPKSNLFHFHLAKLDILHISFFAVNGQKQQSSWKGKKVDINIFTHVRLSKL